MLIEERGLLVGKQILGRTRFRLLRRSLRPPVLRQVLCAERYQTRDR